MCGASMPAPTNSKDKKNETQCELEGSTFNVIIVLQSALGRKTQRNRYEHT